MPGKTQTNTYHLFVASLLANRPSSAIDYVVEAICEVYDPEVPVTIWE